MWRWISVVVIAAAMCGCGEGPPPVSGGMDGSEETEVPNDVNEQTDVDKYPGWPDCRSEMCSRGRKIYESKQDGDCAKCENCVKCFNWRESCIQQPTPEAARRFCKNTPDDVVRRVCLQHFYNNCAAEDAERYPNFPDCRSGVCARARRVYENRYEDECSQCDSWERECNQKATVQALKYWCENTGAYSVRRACLNSFTDNCQ